MDFLKGWKTYLIAAVGIILNGLIATGHIPESARETINSLLAFLGLGTLRAAVKSVETTVEEK